MEIKVSLFGMRNKREKALEVSLRQLLNYLVHKIKWYLLLGEKKYYKLR